MMTTTSHQLSEQSDALCDALRALASGVAAPQRTVRPTGAARELDDRSSALTGLAALLATGGSAIAYDRRVAAALASGMSTEEIVAVLIEVAPTVGLARLVPAAVELAWALGYDIDRALEEADDPDASDRSAIERST
jgi:alkylhydroperoxidase/carboxymuconolactone decarboxylase family protein YurZ